MFKIVFNSNKVIATPPLFTIALPSQIPAAARSRGARLLQRYCPT